jgi:hypothetical protein
MTRGRVKESSCARVLILRDETVAELFGFD